MIGLFTIHGLLGFSRPLLSPTRQREPTLQQIVCGPREALPVQLFRHFVVQAHNVKLSLGHFLNHEIDHLLGSTSTNRLVLESGSVDTSVGPTWDQEVEADIEALTVSKGGCSAIVRTVALEWRELRCYP